ncbi:DnaB-like helicase C-terminal domain-containing protein [uncultured Bosea sp.]|uniref:replicative DNA helicase n=1 Tax=uncultured Bosea sp. TaxID=211457 RepID=UPI0025CC565D|nr:DnaB-like helicase C-terminal domain-containing protein [uncultured Bosea sp.]
MNAPPIDILPAWADNTLAMEIGMLGGVLMHPNSVGSALGTEIEARHFWDAGLGSLWERIRGVALRGDVIDLRTVLQGGATTIFGPEASFEQVQARLLADAVTPSRLAQYCRDIKANWALREFVGKADLIRGNVLAHDPRELVERVLNDLDEVRDVTLDRKGARRTGIGAVAATVATDARAMLAGTGIRPPGSGLTTLDRHLPMRGLAAGALIVLAGRTGMGKTMVASSIANKVSRAGHGVAFFSLEVPGTEIAARCIAENIGGKAPPYGDILAGHICEADLDDIEQQRDELQQRPFYLDDTPALGMTDILVTAKREAARFERQGTALKLVIIDHAQIVKPSSRYAGNRVGELGEVANGAKVLAKQLGCAVILGCQVNRASEGRDDKRPTLADLRASGEIEEAADAVLMLYREAYYLSKSEKYRNRDPDAIHEFERIKNAVEVGVEKSRQGSPGRVTLWCDPARSIIADMAQDWRS